MIGNALYFVRSFFRGTLSLLLLAATIPGCAANHVAQDQPVFHKTRIGRVFLIRGFQDWYSSGIDQLAEELRAQGIDAQAYADVESADVAATVEQSHTPREPLALIGFSYGADDVVSISRELSDRNLPLNLLITIDPVTPDPVPPNVVKCANFYNSNGVWDLFPFLRGVPLETEPGNNSPGGNVINIDITQSSKFYEPGTSHATIAANQNMHRAIVKLVLETCPPR